MLPFCEENTNLLKETDIYADYLIKYNKQLLENLSASYIYMTVKLHTNFYLQKYSLMSKRRE